MRTTRAIALLAAMMIGGVPVSGPLVASAASAPNVAESPSILIVVMSVADIRIDSERFSSIDEFQPALKSRVAANPDLEVIISVPVEKSFGLTVLILDECRKAGVRNIKIKGAAQNGTNRSSSKTSE